MNEKETCQTVELDNFEINIEIQLAVLNGRVCHHAKGGAKRVQSVRWRHRDVYSCVVSCKRTLLLLV